MEQCILYGVVGLAHLLRGIITGLPRAVLRSARRRTS
jgi:hypothetical protein